MLRLHDPSHQVLMPSTLTSPDVENIYPRAHAIRHDGHAAPQVPGVRGGDGVPERHVRRARPAPPPRFGPVHPRGAVDLRPTPYGVLPPARGPLGMFAQPSVEVMGDIPGELISALIDYRENRIKGSAVMDLLDTWRMSAKPPISRVER